MSSEKDQVTEKWRVTLNLLEEEIEDVKTENISFSQEKEMFKGAIKHVRYTLINGLACKNDQGG